MILSSYLACTCNTAGTVPESVCSRYNGTCTCYDNVIGERCDHCKPGFFNLSDSNPAGCQGNLIVPRVTIVSVLACSCLSSSSCEEFTGRCPCLSSSVTCCPYDEYDNGSTCVSCSCHVNGSYGVCHEDGQCVCKPGVGGRNCDYCLHGYHTLSTEGCTPCDCDPNGSVRSSTCDRDTGKCDCLPQVNGDRCDKCPTGMLGPIRRGVMACIPCFCNGRLHGCQSEPGWYWSEALSEFEDEDDSHEWLSGNDQSSIK